MPFKKLKKKVYGHKKPKPKTDFTKGEVWELDMSKPMDEWEFTRVKND